jgi:hypothetical protein
MSSSQSPFEEIPEEPASIKEDRRWVDKGWTAQVIKNEDDDGWAVSMTPDGQVEPALVGPWTMGRDKKNPKPLDTNAFNTLVKTASEVIRRHEQQLHAQLHKSLVVSSEQGRLHVTLDIVPDDDDPHAWLTAQNDDGQALARVRVAANYKLSASRVEAWIAAGFGRGG